MSTDVDVFSLMDGRDDVVGTFVMEIPTHEIITNVKLINELNAEAVGITMYDTLCSWEFSSLAELLRCSERLRSTTHPFKIYNGNTLFYSRQRET